MADTEQPDLTAMTVQLLSAYFSNNQVPAGDIAGIIEATRGALEGKGEAEAPAPVEHVPAVSVRKSLGSREHIISMIDGKPYKTLKRHLATNGLTPAEYRERYKLPRDYPMVAPAYSEHRRAVAAKLGLGRKASETVQKEAPVAEQAVQEAAPTHAPVMEQKPKRTSRKANTATPADEVAGIGLAQTPESTPAQVPEKPKRSRAKAPDAKPATEAPVIAVETPEAAPMASATPGVSAAAAPAPAPAPAPRKAKGACALISATSAMAQADQVRNFDLPAQSLTEALRAVARQSGLEFSAPADPLRGKTSKPLKGQFSPAQAAKRLLKGTRLTAEVIDGALIVRVGGMSADANMSGNGDEIIVTGSHIKSAETASPTIRLDADSIKLAGQTDLGEAIRSVSQNFGGGQNPGVGWGASGVTNQNMDSSSTANLRGLGGDATLTLLNGHRLSYGSFVQAVDLGAIPLAC